MIDNKLKKAPELQRNFLKRKLRLQLCFINKTFFSNSWFLLTLVEMIELPIKEEDGNDDDDDDVDVDADDEATEKHEISWCSGKCFAEFVKTKGKAFFEQWYWQSQKSIHVFSSNENSSENIQKVSTPTFLGCRKLMVN